MSKLNSQTRQRKVNVNFFKKQYQTKRAQMILKLTNKILRLWEIFSIFGIIVLNVCVPLSQSIN